MPSWSFSYSSPLLPKERRGKPKRKKGRNGEIPVADGKGAASHGVACCSLRICVCTCVCACCVWMVMIRECNWARISVYLYLSMDVSVYLIINMCGWFDRISNNLAMKIGNPKNHTHTHFVPQILPLPWLVWNFKPLNYSLRGIKPHPLYLL